MTHPRFQAIGPLLPASPLYVERPADQLAVQILSQPAPDFLLLTEPRQQGKTSFINHLSQHSGLGHCRFIHINAGRLPRQMDEAAWYRLLQTEMNQQLARVDVLPVSSGVCATQEEWRYLVLQCAQVCAAQGLLLVMTFDELGRLPVSWRESFLSLLCELRDARAYTPELLYLTFIFAGSFRPDTMITDASVSPFNKAKSISLDDFSDVEIRLLLEQAQVPADLAARLLPQLLYWTDGQPYIAQWICETLFSQQAPAESLSDLTLVIEQFERRDQIHLPPMLEKVRANLRLLRKAEQVLNGEAVDYAPAILKWQAELTLLGLIKQRASSGKCMMRNALYARALRRMLIDIAEDEQSAFTTTNASHLKQLVVEKTRLQYELELQVAKFGLYAPPHMRIELRDLNNDIASLQQQISLIEAHG